MIPVILSVKKYFKKPIDIIFNCVIIKVDSEMVNTLKHRRRPQMGLDMYFYLRKYESQSKWDEKAAVLNYDEDLKGLENYIFKRNFKSVETKYQVGYFRKFNALHSYIVKTFANGVDECQEIYLSKKDLNKLLDALKSVSKDNASQVLPTQTGFFFGSQNYDEYYFEDVKEAIELITKMLEVMNSNNKWSACYEASW